MSREDWNVAFQVKLMKSEKVGGGGEGGCITRGGRFLFTWCKGRSGYVLTRFKSFIFNGVQPLRQLMRDD